MADTQIGDTVVKTFVVDADDVVNKFLELSRPTSKYVARGRRQSLLVGIMIGVFVADPVIKGLRAATRRIQTEKQNNDGLTS